MLLIAAERKKRERRKGRTYDGGCEWVLAALCAMRGRVSEWMKEEMVARGDTPSDREDGRRNEMRAEREGGGGKEEEEA